MRLRSGLLPLAILCALPSTVRPCTAFGLSRGAHAVMGKSYDWDLGSGLLVVNKRGVAKRSLPPRPGDATTNWVSRYGSVTFDQYGREMPNGGMNEAGLAIEVLWLAQSVFPRPDERPALNELQVVQYGLDTCATVAQLSAALSRVRVAALYGAVHYFACDRAGACAVLEYLGGKLVVTTGEALPVAAITNDSCAESVRALGTLRAVGRAAPPGRGSTARYLRAAAMVASTRPDAALAQRSLEILDSVSQGAYSKWNIVYELDGQKLHFRTRDATGLKDLDLSRLDFSCATPALVLDVNARLSGDVTGKLEAYSTAANERLVRSSLTSTGVSLPEATVRALADYPQRLPCASAAARP
jgi:choloylglycine hydrolase